MAHARRSLRRTVRLSPIAALLGLSSLSILISSPVTSLASDDPALDPRGLWIQPSVDAAPLSTLSSDVEILARNQDLVLMSWPLGLDPAINSLRAEPLGPILESGSYYLFLCEDPKQILTGHGTRLLWTGGHTALLWTSNDLPVVSSTGSDSDETLAPGGFQGMTQWIHVERGGENGSFGFESADRESEPTEQEASTTQFFPEISEIALAVTESEYIDVWQSLDDFETRYTYTTQNEAAADWMYELFQSYGLDVDYFFHQQSGAKKNVIATLPGSQENEQVVYITGHFDSVSGDPDNHAPGADDNGSGTAAVLEAARVLSQSTFVHTIKFAVFNGEEQGLRGSAAYVDWIAQQGEDVLGCINLDMIAYRGTDSGAADLVIYTNPNSAALANRLQDAASVFCPGELEPIVVHQELSASDHYSFWSHGYPAVLGIEDEAWGSDFCPWYHTENDRIEAYPTDYATEVTRAAVATIAQTAVPETPVSIHTVPSSAALVLASFPNPSTGSTRVELAVTTPTDVELAIFDLAGRRVRLLHHGSIPAGVHAFSWNGLDDNGNPLGGGVYWMRMESNLERETRKVVLLR